ncbi:hypothetical protein H4582DRAFT_2084751 [Lactarius indigo]|nr:hypothetical protein H4582DRAFT_2084751 [Lactarius indigo]
MQHPEPPPLPDLPPDALSDSNLYLDHFSTPPMHDPNTFNTAVKGPITVDGNGPPNVAEGTTATATNPIYVSSDPISSFPTLPMDSKMNSPESEEPTVPAIDVDAVSNALTNTNLSSALPPTPEEIVVRGRQRNTSRTPRASRRASIASAWSHISEEQISETNSPIRFNSPPRPAADRSIRDTVDGQLIPPPMTVHQANLKWNTHLTSDLDLNNEEDIKDYEDNDRDLREEFTREINDVVMGYSRYYLQGVLQLRANHDFPFSNENLQTAALLTIQALDAGVGEHAGDTTVSTLTPHGWYCLAMAILAAIIRGRLRSPAKVAAGSKSMNWSTDSFIIHPDLTRPLTEGGTVRCMALQLAEAYDSSRINPLRLTPTEFYDNLLQKQTNVFERAAEFDASKAKAR